MTNVMFKEKQVTIIHDRRHKEIDIGATIYKIVFTDKHIFVLLSWEEFEGTEFYNRNIVCLDGEGGQLWRVEDPDWYRSGKMKTNHPFTSIRIVGNQLEGGTSDGFDIMIDMATGKLMEDWQFTK